MKLQGKTAWITGGGTGIGRAIALAFAAEGCRVVIGGRRIDKLQETAAGHTGENAILMHELDVADRGSVERGYEWVVQKLERVDMLINSAGINVVKRTMAEVSPEDWEKLMAVNVNGAYYCMRSVLPAMRARQDGLIVNICSIAGKRPSVLGGVAYSASKFAMSSLGGTVALEDGPNGIRVTNVYPGEVDTPILEQRPKPVTAEHRARILQGEDVAAAVLMIACLPSRAHVAELIIKPTSQAYA